MGHLRGMPALLLTTVGRKTGKQRVTPVISIRDGGNFVITDSNDGRDKQPTAIGLFEKSMSFTRRLSSSTTLIPLDARVAMTAFPLMLVWRSISLSSSGVRHCPV